MESLSIRKKRKKPKSKKGGSPQTVRGDQHHDRPGSRSGKKRRRRASGGTHANQRRLRLESNPSAEHSIQTKKKKRKNGKGISLVDRFKTKLEGSQFRYLNEELYTAPSETSFKMVKQNAALFDIYHKGFQAQVQRWPANPVEVILSNLQHLPKTTRIGDFGCGEAQIAQHLVPKGYVKVRSFDLAKPNKYVTVCNIRNVPLPSRSLDVAIFCLALMGTDFHEFLLEANRVLDAKGKLIIAEVKSRFAGNHAEDATSGAAEMNQGIQAFVEFLEQLGFSMDSIDKSNQMFVLFHLHKLRAVKNITNAVRDGFKFRPCIYKRR